MLDNPSLLLERSVDAGILDDYSNILIANHTADGYCRQLAKRFADKQFTAFSYLVSHQQTLLGGPDNLTAICDHELKAVQPFDCAIIYFPKSKMEFTYLINNLFNHLRSGSPVIVIGDNKGGVKGCDKLLKPFCSHIRKADTARHCALYQGGLTKPSLPFSVEDWLMQYDVTMAGHQISVYSLPGVFSHGSLDIGTQLLLENIERKPEGKLLDFGCGAGLIGTLLGVINPDIEVTGLDVNALAIASTKETFAANQIKGSTVLSNGLANLEGLFNEVYSNPPFHTGVKTNYKITEDFITGIKANLVNRGHLTIVANNFLQYQPLLEKQFGQFATIAKNRRFNVYHAQR